MAAQTEIAEALEALALHCRPPLMSVEDRTRWMADWCEDLKGEDIAAIRVACSRWRQGTDRKFPMLGQLMPLIRAATLTTGGEKHEPWRPLSEAEYEELSIKAKIRHRRILAANCRAAAGPQWGPKGPMRAEDMPQRWHKLRERADNHDKEAKRLAEIIKPKSAPLPYRDAG